MAKEKETEKEDAFGTDARKLMETCKARRFLLLVRQNHEGMVDWYRETSAHDTVANMLRRLADSMDGNGAMT